MALSLYLTFDPALAGGVEFKSLGGLGRLAS
jgi:hypothetical protein